MVVGLITLHKVAVLLSIIGFFGRGIGHIFQQNWVSKKPVKILPHIVDTLLIVSAVAVVVMTGFSFSDPWILAKVLGLIVYIGLGLMAFRFAKTRGAKALYWVLALGVLFYLVAVAVHKQAWPF
ncbi:SirB2 family protein [Thiomicrospira sp. R3]|uniref:SirB2 family protein n=1 Tax=Thiomicrospira sp. R3 TaxID=3035472 RepID=UPI00259AF7DF|nr:SirB2 family protein [Thiomicrospira sp. R3]WFE69346.1 SirB2 family protein [Thiomicrospira sp. R3]